MDRDRYKRIRKNVTISRNETIRRNKTIRRCNIWGISARLSSTDSSSSSSDQKVTDAMADLMKPNTTTPTTPTTPDLKTDPSTSGQDEDTPPAKKAKKRCGVCKKRLGLTGESKFGLVNYFSLLIILNLRNLDKPSPISKSLIDENVYFKSTLKFGNLTITELSIFVIRYNLSPHINIPQVK